MCEEGRACNEEYDSEELWMLRILSKLICGDFNVEEA